MVWWRGIVLVAGAVAPVAAGVVAVDWAWAGIASSKTPQKMDK
jgi:hypothetical protein